MKVVVLLEAQSQQESSNRWLLQEVTVDIVNNNMQGVGTEEEFKASMSTSYVHRRSTVS